MDKHTHGSLEYFLHGKVPRVLLFSGMHGDEYESGRLLEEYLKENYQTLPHFLYVPQVSPSAVASSTRKNKYGNDINRQFLPTTSDPEAKAVMSLLSAFHFDVCIDVHEDPDRTLGFYLYDTEHMNDGELANYRAAVHATGARLYTGVDDVDDENLNLNVEKGYVSLGFEKTQQVSGFSSRWLYDKSISRRSFTLEIPGRGSLLLKRSLLHTVISFLLSKEGIL